MLTRSWFDALKTRFLRTLNRHERRASGRRQLAARGLKVESLEDRRVLAFVVPPVNYDAGTNPQAIVSADFNGGGLDLAVANSSSSNVSVLLGNGSGGFGAKTDFDTGAYPRSLAVGDVSADGKMDLITANAGDVSILRGDGAGSFAPPDSIALPYVYGSPYSGYVAQSPYSVATGDFNGDGNLDLTVTGVASHLMPYYGYYGGIYGYYQVDEAHVNVLLSDGSGGFQPTVSTPLYGLYPNSVTVGRFNADAIDDLAIANGLYGTVSVLVSNGSGGFSSSTAFYAGYYPYSVAAGDVNGDSIPDLVTANIYGDTISVLLGTVTGSFGAPQSYAAGSQPQSVAIANFNGDSFIDLVTANVDNGTVSVLLGNGTGFTLPVNSAVGSSPVGVAVGDFNGTGGPDLASANNGSDNVSVLLNNGIWPALDAPSITLDSASVAEGQTGTTEMEFTVTLSAASLQSVTVHYATADYNAQAGSDYVAAEGTLVFDPGVTMMTIPVEVIGDRDVEYSEFFYLRLSDATNAFLDRATGVGNIMDDEPRVSISSGGSVVEGNTGTKDMTFTVTLSNDPGGPVTVTYATQAYGSATAGSDYVAKTGTLTFSPNDLTEDITVQIIGDRLPESQEYLYVQLTGATGAVVADDYEGYGYIVDDEPLLSINSPSITEGNSGTKLLTFTVTLSAEYDQPVTVNYATQDGSATAGSDYLAKVGSLTFSPNGPLTQTISVTIKGDKQKENDEYFYLVLSGASSNAMISNSHGLGTILNDEPGKGPGKGPGKP